MIKNLPKFFWFFIFFTAIAQAKLPDFFQSNPIVIEAGAGLSHTSHATDGASVVVSDIQTDNLKEQSQGNIGTYYFSIHQAFSLKKPKFIRLISVGPSFYYQQPEYNGVVYGFGLPNINDYVYTLKNRNIDALLESKIYFPAFNGGDAYAPYILLGAGFNFARVNYQEAVQQGQESFVDPSSNDYNLPTHYLTKFAYDLGAGVRFHLSQHWGLALSYVYLHNGNLTTAISTDSTAVNPLVSPIVFTANSHNLLMTFSYRIF